MRILSNRRRLTPILALLASTWSGCLGAIDGYVLEPLDMGEQLHESRPTGRVDAARLATIGVVNPFRLDGRSDFVCVGRDGQYLADRLDRALAARAVTLDLPAGLSDETVRRGLASWSDDELARALDTVVVPELFVFGSVHERDYELVPLRGYESTITYEIEIVDRAGRPVWSGRDRRRGFVYETPVLAADRLIASLAADLALPTARAEDE